MLEAQFKSLLYALYDEFGKLFIRVTIELLLPELLYQRGRDCSSRFWDSFASWWLRYVI